MKNKSIQTKRDVGKKSGFKILHARIKRKKQRAVAATPEDLGADVPSVGIGRALLVILVLHVIAIGAMVMHSSWRSNEDGGLYTSDVGSNTNTTAPEQVNTATPVVANVAVSQPQKVEPLVEIVEVTHSIIPTTVQQPIANLPPIQSIPRAQVVAQPVAIQPEASLTLYEVKSGDTLWGISRKFNMKVDDIKSLNALSNNSIKPGQRLKIAR